MKKFGLTIAILSFAVVAAAQQGNSVQNKPSGGDSSQSTIQGCLMGSDTTSSFVLTDEHTGEIYLLHGNDALLKQQVGHEVIMTGSASPIRPSDKKGSIGYISPSEPHRTATSANAGQKALNFEVTHIQPVANTCTQESESEKAAVAASQAALGSVRSNSPKATEPKVGYAAQAPMQNNPQQTAPATSPEPPQPVSGKTGNRGEATPVTTTASAGQVTPGEETQAGKAQAAGQQTQINEGGVAPQRNQAAPGAPRTAEQTAQNPADAERIASSAQRAEINNSQHQLGVNAQPNYGQNAQQQTAQANQPVTGPNYEENRNAKNGTELPGASQHISGGERQREQLASEHQQTHPTMVGCLVAGGKSGKEFYLNEKGSGASHRLNASPEELKDHLNHLVEVVGKPAKAEGASKAVAGQDESAFDVSGIQDLAPTCGASH